MRRLGWWVFATAMAVVTGWVILRQRAAALLPQMSARVASCLVLATALSGCGGGGQTAQRQTETPADTAVAAEPAPPPENSDVNQLPQTSIERPGSGEEYIVHGVCPFECCKYGNWTLLRGGPLRSDPSLDADSVGAVAPGAAVRTDQGVMVLHPPGQAVVMPDTSNSSSGAKVGDTVDVITYTGAKVAHVRSRDQEFDMSWSALRMMREPLQRWWVHMSDPATGQEGWMLMGGVSAQEVGAPNSCGSTK